MTIRSVMLGCGSHLPENRVSNKDLESIVDTSDEWIRKRTGIESRHIAADDVGTSDMAVIAAQKALAHAGVGIDTIDGIIVATSTPDHTFPAVATMVQAALGAPHGMAFDVQAVCSGFVYAMTVADNMIKGGSAKRILVIGAEKMSSILNWEDRTTCVLFGDGAGAVILEAQEFDEPSNDDKGVISTHIYANGDLKDILYVNGGPSTTKDSGHIVMQGRDVFKHAVTLMADVVSEALESNQIKASDIDWLVPHQANIRIIEATAKKLNLSMDQVVTTVAHHGNTSAASIPLALDEAVQKKDIKPGDLILMEALGAGLTWGAVLLRY